MKPMTIRDVLNFGRCLLEKNNIETPGLISGVLLCHILNCDKPFLFSHSEDLVKKSDFERYQEYLNRFISGEPLSYITGEREFMSLKFIVGKGVLIPRPETEILVEEAINYIARNYDYINKPTVRILDICTGSGCIAISIANFLKDKQINCAVYGLDISKDALKYAKENAKLNNVSDLVTFYEEDILEISIDSIPKCFIDGKFDLILSNPPYITKKDLDGLDKNVRDFEPLLALDGGEDGLLFYRSIINNILPIALTSGGALFFEVGYDQGATVKDYLENNFQETLIFKDLSGIDRVVAGMLYLDY